jgi:hypothetical protein
MMKRLLGIRGEQATATANTGILRFAQNDDVKLATATVEADLYGMTNKRTNNHKGKAHPFWRNLQMLKA